MPRISSKSFRNFALKGKMDLKTDINFKIIDFESDLEGNCMKSCVSVYGSIMKDGIVIWIHNNRYEFNESDFLNEKMTLLFNSHLYEFVEYLNKINK